MRLIDVFTFERFIGKSYLGQKSFSIEGLDAIVPMLDEVGRPALMFGLLSAPAAGLSLEGVSARALPDAGGTARVDLTVQLEEQGDELRGLAEYATALWDAPVLTPALRRGV